jgi:osmotically inducible protein OsmC
LPLSEAEAVWEGGLRAGRGTIALGDEIRAPCSWRSRFAAGAGANPEQLLAAAEAACFSMAVAAGLERVGFADARIDTRADCALETIAEQPTVTTIRLVTRVRAAGLARATLLEVAARARENCPVSRALEGNVTVVVDADLVA